MILETVRGSTVAYSAFKHPHAPAFYFHAQDQLAHAARMVSPRCTSHPRSIALEVLGSLANDTSRAASILRNEAKRVLSYCDSAQHTPHWTV